MRIRPQTAGWAGAVVGALAGLGLLTSAATAAKQGHVVKVIDGAGQVVAAFRSAQCSIGRLGFFSTASSDRYRLEADVIPFSGFHRYELNRGHFTPQVVMLVSPSGVRYASDFVPPYPVPGGGAINFSRHGHLMGIGFSPMFSADGSDAVTVAGVLACNYPTKKR